MGGAPCVVIILCGGLQASLEGAAAWQGELCENASLVTENLTPQERQRFDKLNAEAVELMQKVDAYTAKSKAAWAEIAKAHEND